MSLSFVDLPWVQVSASHDNKYTCYANCIDDKVVYKFQLSNFYVPCFAILRLLDFFIVEYEAESEVIKSRYFAASSPHCRNFLLNGKRIIDLGPIRWDLNQKDFGISH